jgi:hypothetical protein
MVEEVQAQAVGALVPEAQDKADGDLVVKAQAKAVGDPVALDLADMDLEDGAVVLHHHSQLVVAVLPSPTVLPLAPSPFQ